MESFVVIVLIAIGVVGLLLLIAVILGVTLFFVRRLASSRAAEARSRYPDARLVVANANFFGQESLGVLQGRGNGTLVLTDAELVFNRWVPRKNFRIPLSSIQSIETPTSFLGSTNFTPLLKVVYRNEAGQTDAMAWLVADLAGLKRALEEAPR